MVYKEGQRVVIRVKGKVLEFGDIAIIKAIDYGRLIDAYYCFDAIRNAGEWMAPQHFDKHQERPPVKAPVYDRIKNSDNLTWNVKQPIKRPPAVYTNLKSDYKYDNDDHTSETP